MAEHAAIPLDERPRDAGMADFASSRLEWRRLLAGMANPMDSLEVRWITPGPVTPAMREWFARFPSGTETRDDAYLLRPPLRGLAVKLRNGSFLDLKAFLGSPGLIELPCGGRGTLELWRKWSFSGGNCTPREGSGAVLRWVVVHKERTGAWFPLASGDSAAPGGRQAVQTGCAVELTAISLGAAPYTSVGFEAFGAPELLRPALEHAIGPVFAVPPPPESGFIFSPGNSRSYTQWLHQPRDASQAAAGTTMRGSSLS